MSFFRSEHLTITRAADGGDGLGGHTPGEEVDIYGGPADVQDSGRMLEGIDEGDAVAFLDSTAGIHVGDRAVIEWDPGDTTAARVTKVRRLDSSLLLSYT